MSVSTVRFVYVYGAHGCLHSHDKRVAGEPAICDDHISDPESIRTGITPKYPRDPPVAIKGFSIFQGMPISSTLKQSFGH